MPGIDPIGPELGELRISDPTTAQRQTLHLDPAQLAQHEPANLDVRLRLGDDLSGLDNRIEESSPAAAAGAREPGCGI